MKRIVLTFGFIAGGMMAVMMLATLPFMDRIGMEHGEVIGYTTMVLAFLMVYFGIRSYRDNVAGGAVGFGRAFAVGLLITLIATSCYVATWEVIYYKMMPDFGEKYAAYVLQQARAAGASQQELAAKAKAMADFQQAYRNPLVNVAYTFLEPLPVGLVMTLVCAGFLSRKRRRPAEAGALSGIAAA